MRQTLNYKFQQPDYNNVADIEVLNGNFDILDSELKKKAGEAEVNDAIQKLDIENKLNGKVDKEEGKGLSEQNFTQTEKTKLENLPNEDALNELLNKKIDKTPGKGLSENDFTDAEKEKLADLYNTPIVDNLTDGGRDKALSAEQGKQLFQTVVDGKDAVASAINDIAKKTLANKNMTHQDLARIIKNNLLVYDLSLILKYLNPTSSWFPNYPQKEIQLRDVIRYFARPVGYSDSVRAEEKEIITLEKGVYFSNGSYSDSYYVLEYYIKSIRSLGREKDILVLTGKQPGYRTTNTIVVWVFEQTSIEITKYLYGTRSSDDGARSRTGTYTLLKYSL
ncbi:MAG: hypothetical protein Q4D65_08015 [Peptostreptococcaceae bacterium]|nr:hypothetical protein [Peptostreptococcaceae bacterium]